MSTPSRTIRRLLSEMRRDLNYVRTRIPQLNLAASHKEEMSVFCTESDARLREAQAMWAEFMREIEESPEMKGHEAKKRLGTLNDLLTDVMRGQNAQARKYEVLCEWNPDLLDVSTLLNESAKEISAAYTIICDDLELFSNLIRD